MTDSRIRRQLAAPVTLPQVWLHFTHRVGALAVTRNRTAQRDVVAWSVPVLGVVATFFSLLLVAVAPAGRRTAALAACRRDAPHHRSPNAGWPEAALAGALGLRLAGPRSYGGVPTSDGWMGDGRAEALPEDIEAGIGLAWRAWAVAGVLALAVALVIS